jgi:outer membrane lipoprotein-sorting protein
VKTLEVLLAGVRIREYRQREASGDSVRFEVLEWKPNGKIPEDRFRLEVPPGTKVTRLGS